VCKHAVERAALVAFCPSAAYTTTELCLHHGRVVPFAWVVLSFPSIPSFPNRSRLRQSHVSIRTTALRGRSRTTGKPSTPWDQSIASKGCTSTFDLSLRAQGGRTRRHLSILVDGFEFAQLVVERLAYVNAASSTLYQLDCIRKGPGQTTRVSTDEKYVNSALLACSDKARAYPYPDGDKTRSWVGGELGCVGWGYILMLSITYATTTAAERDNPALQCTKIFPPAFIACWILRLHSAKGTSQNKADSFCTVVTR